MADTKVETAVILAAGNGSRLRPFTNYIPKTMVLYRDKPLMYHHIMNSYNNGIKDIIVVTRHDEENNYSFKFQNDYIKNLERELKKIDPEVKIKLVYQEEDKDLKKPKGPANAVATAEKELKNKSYVVLLGDNLIISGYDRGESLLKKLLERFDGNIMYSVENLDKETAKNCGFIKGKRTRGLDDILIDTEEAIEKPAEEIIKEKFGLKDSYDVMAGGIYIFNEKSIDYLKNVRPGTNNEMHLTDAINDQIMDRASKAFGFIIKKEQYTAADFGRVESWLSINLREENVKKFVEGMRIYSPELRDLIYSKAMELFNVDLREVG